MKILEQVLAVLEGLATIGFVIYWIQNNIRERKSSEKQRMWMLILSCACISISILNCLINEHDILEIYCLFLLPVNLAASFYLIFKIFGAEEKGRTDQVPNDSAAPERYQPKCVLRITEDKTGRVIATDLNADVLQIAILCWKYTKNEWKFKQTKNFYEFMVSVLGASNCFPYKEADFRNIQTEHPGTATVCEIDFDSGTFGFYNKTGIWETYLIPQIIDAAIRTFQMESRDVSQHLDDFYNILYNISSHTRIYMQ